MKSRFGDLDSDGLVLSGGSERPGRRCDMAARSSSASPEPAAVVSPAGRPADGPRLDAEAKRGKFGRALDRNFGPEGGGVGREGVGGVRVAGDGAPGAGHGDLNRKGVSLGRGGAGPPKSGGAGADPARAPRGRGRLCPPPGCSLQHYSRGCGPRSKRRSGAHGRHVGGRGGGGGAKFAAVIGGQERKGGAAPAARRRDAVMADCEASSAAWRSAEVAGAGAKESDETHANAFMGGKVKREGSGRCCCKTGGCGGS